MRYFANLFGMKDPTREKEALLFEAKLKLVEHEAAEEYSKAQAQMLRTRIRRLESELAPPRPIEVAPAQLTAVGGGK